MRSRSLRSVWRELARVLAASAMLLTALGIVPAFAAPEKVSGGIRFTFTDPNASTVAWAGEFNAWNGTANPMIKGAGGVWSIVLPLPAGTQTYKFVVDGQWLADPENSATAGEYGNSVIKIGANGEIEAQKATSNTPYSPKIFIGGRAIGLYQSILNPAYSRYELSRPDMDFDLGFDLRFSDVMTGRFLMNINPRNENVQEYRSRLNFKRGGLTLTQPEVTIHAFDSENLGTWDDPLRLVGGIGTFDHPYGFQRQGIQVRTSKLGLDSEFMYTDNFQAGGVTFPGISVVRPPLPEFVFEADPNQRALLLLQTERTTGGFRIAPGQVGKVSNMDFGDNDKSFGFGDGNENVFAAKIRRELPGALRLGLLGRSDRGFNLGQIALAEPLGDSLVRLRSGQYIQQWYGIGGEARWQPRSNFNISAEGLFGAKRMNLVNGSVDQTWKAGGIGATGATGLTQQSSTLADGQHLTVDRSNKLHVASAWTFAKGDIGLRASAEREEHRYPAWTQPPIIPAGLPPVDHPRVLNVEFQRAYYLNAFDDLENTRTELKFGWDRNWRYYLGREVKTALDVEFTHFDYDARTAWEYQMWFPTGSFWLESGQHVVSIDRLTVLGQDDVVRLRPSLEVPFQTSRSGVFRWKGNFTGVHLGTQPRYAESVFQLGWDWNKVIRLSNDTRWVKYDTPELQLGRGYVSQFTEATYRYSPTIEVALGFGVDPDVLDPNTNEYGYIGRDVYLNQRNANGFIAETDYLSLAPQIAAAEKALMNEKRFQLQAIVHF